MNHRFFVDAGFDGLLTGEDAHHAARVLRLRVGERVVVCDGRKREAGAVIAEVHKDAVRLDMGAWRDSLAEPTLDVVVCIGVAKGERMDYAVQKSVELGATSIVPFVSERCVAKAEGSNKVERWRKIAKQAAAQAGRGVIPDVYAPLDFDSAVTRAAESELALFCYEIPSGRTLKQALPQEMPRSVAVMCGPEGGFSQDEAAFAMKSLQGVTLGQRILRCETAPVAALAYITLNYS